MSSMVNQLQMNPTDIPFKYRVDKYEQLSEFLLSNSQLNGEKTQFLFALTGIEDGEKIPLDTKDSSPKEHTLSRVTYNRNIVSMERDFGLITIIDSLNEPYNEVLNNKAFLKNSDEGVRYLSLPNVSTFYEYLLGGIDPLYDIVMGYGTEDTQIFDALYDYLMSDKNIEFMDNIAKEIANE